MMSSKTEHKCWVKYIFSIKKKTSSPSPQGQTSCFRFSWVKLFKQQQIFQIEEGERQKEKGPQNLFCPTSWRPSPRFDDTIKTTR